MPPSSTLADGPLFRAVTAEYEERAHRLRLAVKAALKQTGEAFKERKSSAQSLDQLDDTLGALSAAATPADVLRGPYADGPKQARTLARREREREVRGLEELQGRLAGASERLKEVEARRRLFESHSTSYYADLGKVRLWSRCQIELTSQFLATTSVTGAKAELLDSKQRTRTAAFAQARADFLGFVQGIVESEEGAIASWLRAFAGVPEPPILDGEGALLARRNSVEEQQISLERKLRDVGSLPVLREADGAYEVSDGAVSDDGGSAASASGGSGFSAVEDKNRRRASLPAVSLEKEGRFRGFMRSAQHSFQAAIPSAHTSPPPATYPTLHVLPPTPAAETLPLSKQELASAARKKEGFLYATKAAMGHSSHGDGGGGWHKFWTVLSEGQLIEFANWRTTLAIRGAPINLRFATARLSRNSDRRFCFEVLTPKERRIYQALNDEDCEQWVLAISKSVESLLNGTSSVRHFDSSHLGASTLTAHALKDFGDVAGARTPSGALGPLGSRLSGWMGEPLNRRASLGMARRVKKGSVEQDSSETGGAELPRHASTAPSTPASSRLTKSPSPSPVVASRKLDPSDHEHDLKITELVDSLGTQPPSEADDLQAEKECNSLSIRRLAELPGNSTCADCSAPGTPSLLLRGADQSRSNVDVLLARDLHLHPVLWPAPLPRHCRSPRSRRLLLTRALAHLQGPFGRSGRLVSRADSAPRQHRECPCKRVLRVWTTS